jgi:hypothetical protein
MPDRVLSSCGRLLFGNPAANIRDYAHLMVVTHIPVVDALALILRRERVRHPPTLCCKVPTTQ